MRLEPNTIPGLRWGLENFDAIETDIRLTADRKLVIFHDPVIPDLGEIKRLRYDEITAHGIPGLGDLFGDERIQELASGGRVLFIELKPDCEGEKVVTEIATDMRQAFDRVLKETGFPLGAIRIISFQIPLLDAFADTYPCLPIIPALNECTRYRSDLDMILRNIPKVFRSLKRHMRDAVKKGYRGVFFARDYVMGPMSIFHPSYKKLVKLAKEMGLDLGTNLGKVELEDKYPFFYRFSDKLSVHPRHAREGEGLIVAHRGTGTKGIEVD